MGQAWTVQYRVPARLMQACAGLLIIFSACAAHAQCLQNNYVHDGAPSSQLDCQPLAMLAQLAPDAMSSADRQLVLDRHAELQQAARFYGFDIDAPGWSYRQAVSPLLRRHLLLVYTNATPLNRASHFSAIVPAARDEKVQVVPAFAHGLHPSVPGWQAKGTYSAFNRLLDHERGHQAISPDSDWVQYAVLYLTLIGNEPSVPTESDSIKANWNLSVKRGTTPVVIVTKNGSATIAFSDLSSTERITNWKLIFNKQGQIEKADRTQRSPGKVHYMLTEAPAAGEPSQH